MKFSKCKVLTMCLLIAIAAQGVFAGSQCKNIFAVQQDRLIAEGCTSPIAFCAGGTFTGNHGFRGNFFFVALSFDQILTDPNPFTGRWCRAYQSTQLTTAHSRSAMCRCLTLSAAHLRVSDT